VESDSPKFADAKRLEKELKDVKAHLAALIAVVGGITTAGTVNFERLEECVNFAVKGARPGARPVVLAKAAAVLEDLEGMQKALEIEARRSLGLKVAGSRSPRSRTYPNGLR
jgi:hypothetical protein